MGQNIAKLFVNTIIIIMYIYHALIKALSAHMIHINLNMIFYTHVSLGKTRNIPVKYLFSPNHREKYMGARHELQTDKGTIPP